MAKFSDVTPDFTGPRGRFVDAEERAGIMLAPLAIVGVRWDEANRFGPRWIVDAVRLTTDAITDPNGEAHPGPELVAIGLKGNPLRNEVMTAARAALKAGAVLDPVMLAKSSDKADAYWTFVDATDYPADFEAMTAAAIEAAQAKADEPASDGPTALPGERLTRAKAAK